MIKLKKLEEPDVLKDSAAAWTQALLMCEAAGIKPSDAEKNKYKNPAIKSVLMRETNGKCAYCESKLLHSSYGDVEHIVPKSARIELTFEWSNLTISCDVCNTNKGNKFPDGVGFIDPYLHEPSENFNIIGPLVLAKSGNNNARLTEEALKLNRAELVERREQRIRALRDQIEVIRQAPLELRGILAENLNEEIKEDKEFTAIARSCIPLLLM